ncbi:hypothetical protein Fmac_025097 [Flemingia macrophylla]|uniref:Ribonucleotide reductase large subunit C-terminal domain-containing protein n=1 Tax=Flemingia macrophylla TaxID=520843 RepID=A0ABD1LRA3_9FABA
MELLYAKLIHGVPMESHLSKLVGSSDSGNRYFDYDKLAELDMWGVTPSNHCDWNALREMISKNDVRNSLLVALMPTASISQILGNNKCFEPYTSNIYSHPHTIMYWHVVVVNKHILHDLTEMGLWSPTLKNHIIYEDGSVQNIPEIPHELKAINKYDIYDFLNSQNFDSMCLL